MSALDRAMTYVEQRVLAGKSIRRNDVVLGAGVANATADTALKLWRQKSSAGHVRDEDIVLKEKDQAKLDRKLKAHQRILDLKFAAAVEEESRRKREAMSIPAYLNLLNEVKRLVAQRKGIMTKRDFNLLLVIAHGGMNASPEKLRAVFDVLKANETLLVMDKDDPRLKAITEMPATREELMARRKRA